MLVQYPLLLFGGEEVEFVEVKEIEKRRKLGKRIESRHSK